MDERRFYGYKHWTLEEQSRCFYVGKGLKSRPWSLDRSQKWKSISKRYGYRVEICIGPTTNEEVCVWEVENIRFENTFRSEIGCNFTLGGDGISGFKVKEETKSKIRESRLGKSLSTRTKIRISNSLKGRKASLHSRKRMSLSKRGKPGRKKSQEERDKISQTKKGRKLSPDHRQKLIEAWRRRKGL